MKTICDVRVTCLHLSYPSLLPTPLTPSLTPPLTPTHLHSPLPPPPQLHPSFMSRPEPHNEDDPLIYYL